LKRRLKNRRQNIGGQRTTQGIPQGHVRSKKSLCNEKKIIGRGEKDSSS